MPERTRPAYAMLVVALACCVAAAPSLASTLPHYRVEATVSRTAPQIRGTVETTVTNRSTHPSDAVVLVLFANRFAAPDTDVTDVNRAFVYPYEEFAPGSMAVREILVDGAVAPSTPLAQPGVPEGCLLRVALPATLPPGAAASLRVSFETVVPTRFGSFGAFDGMLTAVGGWYPSVAPWRGDGTAAVDALPDVADFDVQLHVDPQLEVVLNGRHVAHPTSPIDAQVRGVHYLSLVAAPTLLRDEVDADGTHIVFFRRPPVRHDRRAFGPSQLEITLEALRKVVAARPTSVPHRDDVVVVEAPLRLTLSAPGEGMVVLSDRALKVFGLLRPFHEVQLAQAMYAELLRPQLVPRESPRDFAWVSEGLSYELARAYRQATQSTVRSVQEWIELFNVFAIVDRFEVAPKIPFVGAFFERSPSADPLHEQITTFNNDLPPGHVIFGKLRQRLGDAAFASVVDRCVAAQAPFRSCAAATTNVDLGSFFAQWVQPYPEINYDFAGLELNERRDDTYRSTVTVRRAASREVHEPVDVELRSIGEEPVHLRWDGSGDQGRLTATTAHHVNQAVIDPDRKLIETTRADDARPPTPQVVLDSAEVEVSSTEFGFSGLLVGRGRYDYQKDIAAFGFYTNRSIGVDVGPRLHWGEPNDPTLYRHNLYAFYDVQALDGGFQDDRHPEVHTRGHVNGLGLRYDYNNVVAFDNPTHKVDFRLFGDWFDRGLGSSFDYADWGGSLVLTHPLWTHRTILAGEITTGFSEPLGSSRIPLQGLFSLGGSRSIRGIGAEDELARNIFLVRTELRQMIYPELDLNLLDLLVLRRAQVRLFVDTGQVSNSAGAVYDPRGYAVGAGVGFAAVYDFMGFFPSLAYIEIATRADRRPDDVQFLFGTRQSF
jgi:Omp85 superfamily domain